MGTLSLQLDHSQVCHTSVLPIIWGFLEFSWPSKASILAMYVLQQCYVSGAIMIITLMGKTDLTEKKIHFQETILKLPQEVSWTTPTHLHQFIYAFWIFSPEFTFCESLELKMWGEVWVSYNEPILCRLTVHGQQAALANLFHY